MKEFLFVRVSILGGMRHKLFLYFSWEFFFHKEAFLLNSGMFSLFTVKLGEPCPFKFELSTGS